MERSAHLAAMADSLWFAPGCRLPVNGGAAGRRGAGVWRQLQAFEMGKDPTVLTVHTGGLRHGMTPERATCLAAVWASRTWPGAQRLKKKCVLPCERHYSPPPVTRPPWRGAPQLSVSRTARGYRGPRLRAGGSLPCREA